MHLHDSDCLVWALTEHDDLGDLRHLLWWACWAEKMRQDGAKEQLLGFKSWGHPQRCNGPARKKALVCLAGSFVVRFPVSVWSASRQDLQPRAQCRWIGELAQSSATSVKSTECHRRGYGFLQCLSPRMHGPLCLAFSEHFADVHAIQEPGTRCFHL